jgi:hypothetical protein
MASTPQAVATHAELCVVGGVDDDVLRAIEGAPHARIVDLVRFPGSEGLEDDPRYTGLCW